MIAYSTLLSVMLEMGEPAYRAGQVYTAVTRGLVSSFDQIISLPASLRERLGARLSVSQFEERERRVSADGKATKVLLAAADGAAVESVLLRARGRATVCVSSQVGCAVRCAFCASGRLGFRRDLSAEEIADQVLHFARMLRERRERVTNVVVMGMGEPFLNYEETLRGCRLLTDPDGFGLSARGISVSTAGVAPRIRQFAADGGQMNLAVSLHAATDEVRDRLVPLNRRYPVAELFRACEEYTLASRRKLFLEYVLLPGVNDGDEQVRALRRARRQLFHVNLIGVNPVTLPAGAAPGADAAGEEAGGDAEIAFRAPGRRELYGFRERLARAGVPCTVRSSPGRDIDAACGQLALRSASQEGCPGT
jgi:23S rRNA (adenine2503-C2)-methyltransferase